LKNNGNKDVSNLELVELASAVTGSKAPGSDAWKKPTTFDETIHPRINFDDVTRRLFLLRMGERLILKPEEQESVVSSMAGPVDSKVYALFSLPGQYFLQMQYRQTHTESFNLKPISMAVMVRKGEGDDAGALRLIESSGLAPGALSQAVILRAGGLDVESQEVVEKILKKYPKSSYADYCRFMEADKLLSRYKIRNKAPKQMPRGERDQAIAYLQAINLKQYPYAADALLLLREVYKEYIGDLKEVKNIEAQLEAEFKADLAWIEAQSDRIPLEKLIEDSKKPPVQRGPRNPNP